MEVRTFTFATIAADDHRSARSAGKMMVCGSAPSLVCALAKCALGHVPMLLAASGSGTFISCNRGYAFAYEICIRKVNDGHVRVRLYVFYDHTEQCVPATISITVGFPSFLSSFWIDRGAMEVRHCGRTGSRFMCRWRQGLPAACGRRK